MAPLRFAATLIGVFAAIAALLAAVGLYGVLSTLVRQRTAEIGLRIVLGADPRGVFRMIVSEGLRMTAIGVVLGVVVALAMTRVTSGLLVGVPPTDPMTYVLVTLTFFSMVVVAGWLPARRAARLDPSVALREE
jgi:putative ABC transport system permease protein